MHDAIYDVLTKLHKARAIADEASRNEFEEKCGRIAISLRWADGICFVIISVSAR